MEVLTQQQWIKDGVRRFGIDLKAWRFKCPHCGRVQTVEDFKSNSVKYGFAHVYFCCISRWVNPESCGFTCASKPKQTVSWRPVEAVKRHLVEVISLKGIRVPVFQYAEPKNPSNDFIMGDLKRTNVYRRAFEEKPVPNNRGGWSVQDRNGVTCGNFATPADARRTQKWNGQ